MKINQEILSRFGESNLKTYKSFSTLDKKRYYTYISNFIEGKNKRNKLKSPQEWFYKYRDNETDCKQFLEFSEIAMRLNLQESQVRKAYYQGLQKIKQNPLINNIREYLY